MTRYYEELLGRGVAPLDRRLTSDGVAFFLLDVFLVPFNAIF